jgi:hypothetical protein
MITLAIIKCQTLDLHQNKCTLLEIILEAKEPTVISMKQGLQIPDIRVFHTGAGASPVIQSVQAYRT